MEGSKFFYTMRDKMLIKQMDTGQWSCLQMLKMTSHYGEKNSFDVIVHQGFSDCFAETLETCCQLLTEKDIFFDVTVLCHNYEGPGVKRTGRNYRMKYEPFNFCQEKVLKGDFVISAFARYYHDKEERRHRCLLDAIGMVKVGGFFIFAEPMTMMAHDLKPFMNNFGLGTKIVERSKTYIRDIFLKHFENANGFFFNVEFCMYFTFGTACLKRMAEPGDEVPAGKEHEAVAKELHARFGTKDVYKF